MRAVEEHLNYASHFGATTSAVGVVPLAPGGRDTQTILAITVATGDEEKMGCEI